MVSTQGLRGRVHGAWTGIEFLFLGYCRSMRAIPIHPSTSRPPAPPCPPAASPAAPYCVGLVPGNARNVRNAACRRTIRVQASRLFRQAPGAGGQASQARARGWKGFC